jgi:hypothetical protein
MFVEKLVKILPIESNAAKLIIGSAISALAISAGFIGICQLLALPTNAGMAAALAAIGAAIYGIRGYRSGTQKGSGD